MRPQLFSFRPKIDGSGKSGEVRDTELCHGLRRLRIGAHILLTVWFVYNILTGDFSLAEKIIGCIPVPAIFALIYALYVGLYKNESAETP